MLQSALGKATACWFAAVIVAWSPLRVDAQSAGASPYAGTWSGTQEVGIDYTCPYRSPSTVRCTSSLPFAATIRNSGLRDATGTLVLDADTIGPFSCTDAEFSSKFPSSLGFGNLRVDGQGKVASTAYHAEFGAFSLDCRGPAFSFSLAPRSVQGSLDCNGTLSAPACNVAMAYRVVSEGAAATNYSDLWWNPAESGWGVSIADHETHLFAVWFTYRQDGSPTWFVMSGGTFSEGRRRFTGDAYQTTGPPFNAPFSSRPVTLERVGTFTFDFAPPGMAAGTALFSYSVNGIAATKQIQRQPFGNAAPAWGTDLTDLWWDSSESGWGLSINQHGNNVFAVWYTYDASGLPLFVIMPGVTFQGSETFSGPLYTTRGPWFGGGTFDASQVQVLPFGDATIDFSANAPSAAPKIWRPKTGRVKIRTRTNVNLGDVINKVIKQQRFGYDAPGTPPVACNATYGDWSACAADGFQSRLRIATNPPGCPSEPYEFRPCVQEPSSCTYTYSDWSECQNGSRTRQVLSSAPTGCTGTPGPLTEQCTVAPLCSYSVGDWSACVNGVRTRSVTASPPSCRANNPPPGSEACTSTGASAPTCTGNFTATAGPPYCGPASFSGRIRLEATDLAMTGSQRLKVALNPGVHFCDGAVYEWPEDLTISSTRDAGGTVVASGRQGDPTYQFDISFRVPSNLNVTGSVSLQQFVPNFPQYNWKWTGTFSCVPP